MSGHWWNIFTFQQWLANGVGWLLLAALFFEKAASTPEPINVVTLFRTDPVYRSGPHEEYGPDVIEPPAGRAVLLLAFPYERLPNEVRVTLLGDDEQLWSGDAVPNDGGTSVAVLLPRRFLRTDRSYVFSVSAIDGRHLGKFAFIVRQ